MAGADVAAVGAEKGRKMSESQRGEQLLTAYEWNDKLDYQILDYDGFRDGTIDTQTRMSREEFERRALQSTRKLTPEKLRNMTEWPEDLRVREFPKERR